MPAMFPSASSPIPGKCRKLPCSVSSKVQAAGRADPQTPFAVFENAFYGIIAQGAGFICFLPVERKAFFLPVKAVEAIYGAYPYLPGSGLVDTGNAEVIQAAGNRRVVPVLLESAPFHIFIGT
jgi:hypothetical protein